VIKSFSLLGSCFMDACFRSKIRTDTAYLRGYVPVRLFLRNAQLGPTFQVEEPPISVRHRLEQCVVSDTVEGAFAEDY
jgi:hypothetical protein